MDSVLSFPYLGIPKTSQKFLPGNTATGIAAGVIAYQQFTVPYSHGGTTEITAGMTIVGATSAATATVVSLTLTGGTWAGGDAAGVLTIANVVGTFQKDENIKVMAGTNDATITAAPAADTSDYPFKGATAKAVIVQTLAQSVLMQLDGTSPDQTYKRGFTLTAGTSFTIVGPEAIRNARFVDAVSNTAGTINVIGFFHGPWGAAG